MKIHITSLALLAFQNTIVSADTSSSISDLTSRLESIKNAAAAMVEEISQKETELMNEELASQKESVVINEEVEFEDTQLEGNMTFVTYQEAKKLIDGIPDDATHDKVHELIEEGKGEEAAKLIDEFFDTFIENIEDEKAKEDMEGNKEPILKALHIVIKHEAGQESAEFFEQSSEEDAEEVEFEDTQLEGNMTFVTYQKAKKLIDGIPDDATHDKVHELIEEGKGEEAAKLIDEFFDTFIENIEDEKSKEDMEGNKEPILKALHIVIKHEAGQESAEFFEQSSEGEVDGESSVGEVKLSLKEATQDKKDFEDETKEDTKEEMSKVLKEIAENQLLVEEALEKLGGN